MVKREDNKDKAVNTHVHIGQSRIKMYKEKEKSITTTTTSNFLHRFSDLCLSKEENKKLRSKRKFVSHRFQSSLVRQVFSFVVKLFVSLIFVLILFLSLEKEKRSKTIVRFTDHVEFELRFRFVVELFDFFFGAFFPG